MHVFLCYHMGMKNQYLESLDVTNKDTPSLKFRLLTRQETADRFSVHKETIKRWERKGLLKAIVINSRVTRYDPLEVERLIASGMVSK